MGDVRPHKWRFEAGAVRAVAEGPVIAGQPVPQWLGLGRSGCLVAVARWEDGRTSCDFGPGALLRGPGGYVSDYVTRVTP